jgi:hypothetical protein
MSPSVSIDQRFFRRHYALPQEHGAWVFVISPLLIGLFSGGKWTSATLPLIVATIVAFLIRQPTTIVVKAYSGRRSKNDLAPAWFWIATYGTFGLVALMILIVQGYAYLLLLGIPGIPVFIWHLILVSRRAERRQMGIELVGSGVLALAAPAAMWVGIGYPDPFGWLLFVLVWLQSACSIVYAYLRLEQRELIATPDVRSRLRMGSRAILYASFNLLFTAILGILAIVPSFIWIPYALQWSETLYGTLNPAIGVKPTKIGIRQLIVSSLFTLLFVIFNR